MLSEAAKQMMSLQVTRAIDPQGQSLIDRDRANPRLAKRKKSAVSKTESAPSIAALHMSHKKFCTCLPLSGEPVEATQARVDQGGGENAVTGKLLSGSERGWRAEFILPDQS